MCMVVVLAIEGLLEDHCLPLDGFPGPRHSLARVRRPHSAEQPCPSAELDQARLVLGCSLHDFDVRSRRCGPYSLLSSVL